MPKAKTTTATTIEATEQKSAELLTQTEPQSFASRIQQHDLHLNELESIGAIDQPLPEIQAKFKNFDISTAAALFDSAIADHEEKLKTVREAEAALEAIEQPAPYQPKPGISSIFDGLKAEIDSIDDAQHYQRAMASARARVSSLKAELPALKQSCIVLGYFADLHSARQAIAPHIEKYRQILIEAAAAKEAAAASIREQMSNLQFAREHRFQYLPSTKELEKISIGGPLPALPESILEESESDIIPRKLEYSSEDLELHRRLQMEVLHGRSFKEMPTHCI